MKRIYLAGPDVFRPNARAIGDGLKAECTKHGAIGLFPIDNEVDVGGYPEKRQAADAIRYLNEGMIRSCDGVVASFEPFRGPGLDGGTAYEIGFARALDKPVIGYRAGVLSYAERVQQSHHVTMDENGLLRDENGDLVEDFGLADNLMMATGVRSIEDSPAAAISKLLQVLLF